MSEIIKFEDFKKKKSLSDEDIKSLFLGLVNLIKTNAIEDVTSKIRDREKQNLEKLNNTLIKMKIKDEIIEDLREENEKLKSKSQKLIEKIEQLKKVKNENKNNEDRV